MSALLDGPCGEDPDYDPVLDDPDFTRTYEKENPR